MLEPKGGRRGSSLSEHDLPIIQKHYALILWYVPVIQRFPREYKHVLGDRMLHVLYDILDRLLRARYQREKLSLLEGLNAELDVLRYQTRMCRDAKLMDSRRYGYVSQRINEIGMSLGGWIRQQKKAGA